MCIWVNVAMKLLIVLSVYPFIMIMSEAKNARFILNLIVSLGLLVLTGVLLYLLIMLISGTLGILYIYS